MHSIPRDPHFDSSLALRANPYGFIPENCRRHHSDVFEARILLRRTLCLTGPRAAELFYDPARFKRGGGAPEALQATLFGKGGVQGLDDAEHRQRKALFMALVAPERVADLARIATAEWERAALVWSAGGRINLYHALQQLLTRAVCAWAGVPLGQTEATRRSWELTALFDQAAEVGLGHFSARMARRRAEKWLAGLVEDVRAGKLPAGEGTALATVARHRDMEGKQLAPRIAAVELLNVLRPTVAVSLFIVFTAHALHLHPEGLEPLRRGDAAYAEAFVQEVRRWYPFFPAVAARVREDFDWEGFHFPRGRRVMLDLYGTNHDPRAWEAPEEFRPGRFLEKHPTPFEFIPQGGAEPQGNHRCPGEGITVALMEAALYFLVHRLEYRVPEQDLSIDTTRLPALPREGFVISDVRLREPGSARAGERP